MNGKVFSSLLISAKQHFVMNVLGKVYMFTSFLHRIRSRSLLNVDLPFRNNHSNYRRVHDFVQYAYMYSQIASEPAWLKFVDCSVTLS